MYRHLVLSEDIKDVNGVTKKYAVYASTTDDVYNVIKLLKININYLMCVENSILWNGSFFGSKKLAFLGFVIKIIGHSLLELLSENFLTSTNDTKSLSTATIL